MLSATTNGRMAVASRRSVEVNSPTNEISPHILAGFLSKHSLPAAFEASARRFYEPLARRLPSLRRTEFPLLLGVNGAQGTGKSTLADFLAMAVAELFDWRSAVLSIDDFYLPRDERLQLAQTVHPLFATRGVPGTHDTELIQTTLDELTSLGTGHSAVLPRFDKAVDDRAPKDEWPSVTGPLDLIVLEGWCVGSSAETEAALAEPANVLERDEDAEMRWRGYANERLRERYEPIFSGLDALVFLAAPSFEAILRWRIEQEHKLAQKAADPGSRVMSDDEVARFVRFYERITRHNLIDIPTRADVVFTLGEDHGVTEARYR